MARVVESGKASVLESEDRKARRAEWRPWRRRGCRVAGRYGLTIWHETEAVRRPLLDAFDGFDADVFLFGAQASGAVDERSDHDVGVMADPPVSSARLEELRERLEELPILIRVEGVDFIHHLTGRDLNPALDFEDCWEWRAEASLCGTAVPLLCVDDPIALKRGTGALQDEADADALTFAREFQPRTSNLLWFPGSESRTNSERRHA